MKFLYLFIALILFVVDLVIFFQNFDSMWTIKMFGWTYKAPGYLIYIMFISFLLGMFFTLALVKFLTAWEESDDGFDI